MTAVIKHLGVEYLPLRAVPLVTSGVLGGTDMAKMIVDYESYHHPDYPAVITPLIIGRPYERLLPVERSGFVGLAYSKSNTTTERLDGRLPPGILVSKEAVRDKFDMVVDVVWRNRAERPKANTIVWHENPVLSAEDWRFVLEGFALPRKNSRAATMESLRFAFGKVVQTLAAAEICIDEHRMPGVKADWIKILKNRIPSLETRSHSTWKDDFKDIGLKWIKGRNPVGIAAVLDALGDDLPI